MISASSTGDFKKTEKFLEAMKSGTPFKKLDTYGRRGVDALSSATPKDTGETAHSWKFESVSKGGGHAIVWANTHKGAGGRAPIALMIEYGHGTGTGGYVPPRPYINSAISPVMDAAIEAVWSEVRSA